MLEDNFVVCDGRGADGKVCGASGKVIKAHHEYAAGPDGAHRLGELVKLTAELQCPRCGNRRQTLFQKSADRAGTAPD